MCKLLPEQLTAKPPEIAFEEIFSHI